MFSFAFGRCRSDERLIGLAEIGVIVDARPKANAHANKAKGGGFENTEYYHMDIQFLGIENIQ